jgi:hypothetical protein
VNGARLNWKPLPDGFCGLDHKGTDVMLKGFADFIARGGDAELVLFRKGQHVAETEALVESLGIASHVIWRAEVTLHEYHAEITQADVVCDNLGETIPGMASLDALAHGVPVIANFRPEINHPTFPKPVAACQARASADVTAHLTTLARSIDARVDAGRAAWDYAKRYFSPVACAVRCANDLGRSLQKAS